MAQPRRQSTGARPHSVSLKVLRLSKPSLAPSHVLPSLDSHDVLAKASLPYPSAPHDTFPLNPLLALPPAFGAAYVGTTFACTLCANNELSPTSLTTISSVSLSAELQTPTGTIPLTSPTSSLNPSSTLDAGATLQKVISHSLKEDGPHVLAVTVSYTETSSETSATNARTFRKLYQFTAQPALGIRTKIASTRAGAAAEKSGSGPRVFALEAQLENLTADTVVLDSVSVITADGFSSRSLNFEEGEEEGKTVLASMDVQQVAFLLKEQEGAEVKVEERSGRVVLARLEVVWRSGMGERGEVVTGWLGARGR